MSIVFEKNEHYGLFALKSKELSIENAKEVEKTIVHLIKEGNTTIIADLSAVHKIDEDGISLIRKATRVCTKEGGMFLVVNDSDHVLDKLQEAEIEDFLTLKTTEEAIDAVFMNQLENEFMGESPDDEFDMEDGFGIEKEQ